MGECKDIHRATGQEGNFWWKFSRHEDMRSVSAVVEEDWVMTLSGTDGIVWAHVTSFKIGGKELQIPGRMLVKGGTRSSACR